MATKTTAYQRLQKAKGLFCKGKKTKAQVKKVADIYIRTAVKKGKTPAEAKKIAGRILKGGCKISSSINKTKRKKK